MDQDGGSHEYEDGQKDVTEENESESLGERDEVPACVSLTSGTKTSDETLREKDAHIQQDL